MERAVTPTAVQLQAMSDNLTQLRSVWAQASTDVNGAWFSSGASKDAANASLAQSNAAIGVLASVQWNNVLSGAQTFDAWQLSAQEILSGIQYIDADLASWTLSGVVASTASQTVTDVKHDVAIAGLISAPLLLLAGGAYLFLVLGLGRR